jgi:ribosomal protein L7/L12
MTDAKSLQQLLDNIKAHIATGGKIEAIELYRDATGAELAEAKEAIELIAAGRPPKPESGARISDRDTQDRLSAAIAAGRKIEAIRLYRESTGTGLKDAKDAVDALERQQHPARVKAREAAVRRVRHVVMLGFLAALGLALLISVLTR